MMSSMSLVELENMQAIIRQGIEVERLQHEWTKDGKSLQRIMDGELFLRMVKLHTIGY